MKRLISVVVFLLVLAPMARGEAPSATVRGYVMDSACLFIKKLDKPVGKECALSCAKAGSPLVILAEDGKVYLPISSEMPAAGQNDRLMKFAGDKVVVKGRLFERGGSHAIVIEEIEAASTER